MLTEPWLKIYPYTQLVPAFGRD